MTEPKSEPKKSDKDPQKVQAAEAKARQRAIESQKKEIVVFPEKLSDG